MSRELNMKTQLAIILVLAAGTAIGLMVFSVQKDSNARVAALPDSETAAPVMAGWSGVLAEDRVIPGR